MTRTPIPAEFQIQDKLSDKQLSFLNNLIDERDLLKSVKLSDVVDSEKLDAYREALKRQATTLTRKQASAWIERLLALPKRNVPREGSSYNVAGNRNCPLPDVPEGRYAVEHEGVLKFYRVDKPTEGRWAGWTFLSVQASDELHPIKNFDYKRTILTEIAADPMVASARYGHELGQCGVCGRTLTDEESRARGIGPVCARRNGWL